MAGVLEAIFDGVCTLLHYEPDAVMLALAVIVFLILPRKKVFAVSILLTLFLAIGAKSFYAEPRPCVTAPSLVDCPDDYGLPSSHAAISAIFPLATLGTPLFYFFAPFALLTWISRVYLGVHTLQQVAGGVAFGAIIFLLVSQLFKRLGEEE